ncbi:hypothetical protein [uncultured Cohaesibacter sp.]|uniref:hypothetical protein n=1 Tax=uncultured Cohaesibacter sp. TaxID=1002546 RepID=UPI00292CE071
MRIFLVFLLFCLSGPAMADSFTYKNDRFGTSAELPLILKPTTAAGNGDGYRFNYPGLIGTASVWGGYNTEEGGREGYKHYVSGFYDEITYSASRNDWFVLSGWVKGKIFYLRVQGCNAGPFHHIYFEFPENEKPMWQPIIEQFAKTVHGPCSN